MTMVGTTRRRARAAPARPRLGEVLVGADAPLGAVLPAGMLGASRADPAERAAAGKAARAQTPRRGQGVWRPPPDRADPVDILERQSRARLAELVPIRYERMISSPFRFYRGAAAIMAADLAGTATSGIDVQLCGDAHLLNFRLLASPERHLVFDINDFDETHPGPWEWDVKRLAASLVIAGRAGGHRPAERRRAVVAAIGAYRVWMRRFAAMNNLDVWYAHVDVDALTSGSGLPDGLPSGRSGRSGRSGALPERPGDALDRQTRRRLETAAARARTRDRRRAYTKLTEVVDGTPRFVADPPLLVPLRDLLDPAERAALTGTLADVVERYGRTLPLERRALLRQYRLVDVARKVVGVGSVGTRCWVALLLGRDNGDPLLLQLKEAQASVLAEHLPGIPPSTHLNQGERVVLGQRLMQASSDIFLGWQRIDGIDGRRRDFYVRQLADWKGVPVAEMMSAGEAALFGQLCGATLARAHARSGDRVALAAYLGRSDTFETAIATFAEAYADQNERDHAALAAAAARSGRVPASSDGAPTTGR